MGITSNPSNFSSAGKRKSKRGIEGGKKKRGGRNEATLEKGEETVRPGIESVSNEHEQHGASRRQASSAD